MVEKLLDASSELALALEEHYGDTIDVDKPQSRSQSVYDYILDRLWKGEIRPGDQINRRQIAEECGFSVAPVLEAMKQLETEGFLEVTASKTTRIRLSDLEDLRGQVVIREALEGQAARLYCGEKINAAYEELTSLAKIVDEKPQNNLERCIAEMHFHTRLIGLTECPALVQLYKRMMKVGYFYLKEVILSQPTYSTNHQELARNLCISEDPYVTESLVREHILRGLDTVLRLR